MDNHKLSVMDDTLAITAVRAQLEEVTRRLHGAGLLGEQLLAQQQRLEEALAVPTQLSEKLSELERELDNIKRNAGENWIEADFLSRDGETCNILNTPKWSNHNTVSPLKHALSMRRRPSKLSARAHDIEFATEIGQSLLTEVRRLQGILDERDAQWKVMVNDKRVLEQQIEGLELRLKALGESEERYKEENWDLELKTQDLNQKMTEASAAELRMIQENSRLLRQTQIQMETLEALRIKETELNEEIEQLRVRNELDAASFRRVQVELLEEKAELIRQIEELKAELESRQKSFYWSGKKIEEDDCVVENEIKTSFEDAMSEQWSPLSPIKCTPSRNPPLETETMKASFSHAQRTIYGLRGALQREKAEKMELRQQLNEVLVKLEKWEQGKALLRKKPLKRRPKCNSAGMTYKSLKGHASEITIESETEWKDEQDTSEITIGITPHIEENGLDQVKVHKKNPSGLENGSLTEEDNESVENKRNKPSNYMEEKAYTSNSDFSAGIHDDSDTCKGCAIFDTGKRRTLSFNMSQQNQPLFKELEMFNQNNCLETVDVGTMTDEVSDIVQIKIHLFGQDTNIIEQVISPSFDKDNSKILDTTLSSRNVETNHLNVNHSDVNHLGTHSFIKSSQEMNKNGISAYKNNTVGNSMSESHSRPFLFSSIVSIFKLGRKKSVQMSPGVLEINKKISNTSLSKSKYSIDLFNHTQTASNLGLADSIKQSQNQSTLKLTGNIDCFENESDLKLANSDYQFKNTSQRLNDSNLSHDIVNKSRSSIMESRMTPSGKIIFPFYLILTINLDQEATFLSSEILKDSIINRSPHLHSLNRSIGSRVLKKLNMNSNFQTMPRIRAKQIGDVKSNTPNTSFDFLSYDPYSKKSSTFFSTPINKKGTLSEIDIAIDSVHATRNSSSSAKITSVYSLSTNNAKNSQLHMDDFKIPAYTRSSIDPKIIHSITQTMIGEYLWKYTRKHARQELSRNRHLRFFWIHPYSRSLYWCKHNPSATYGQELYAKSAFIESIKVVYDRNSHSEEIYNKSIIVTTPVRAIKFTATSSNSHEIWYQALSYLVSRIDPFIERSSIRIEDSEEITTQSLNSQKVNENSSSLFKQSKSSLSAFSSTSNITSFGNTLSLKRQNSLSKLGHVVQSSINTSTTSLKFKRPHPKNYVLENEHRIGHGERINSIVRYANLEDVRSCCDGKHNVATLPYRSKSFSSDSRRSRSSSLCHSHANASIDH
ncbi:hypothetical protein PCANB_001727 [Pneumocystis canis]|nr:hypothetical protein PCANB_001727 [Pneumocystis canis]